MNIGKYIVAGAFLLMSARTEAKPFVWYAGGHLHYQIQKSHSDVVSKALQMFSSDMHAVTGRHAAHKDGATVAIYQLDQVNNKEMKQLDKLSVPYSRIITKSDAFWIGVRGKQLIVVGSDGRGTAYGILELSRLAGVSPWIYWGDVVPERKTQLTVDDKFETIQSPSVALRGVAIQNADWSNKAWDARKLDTHMKVNALGPHYYHKLFELMLRLRGNTLWTEPQEGEVAFDRVKGCKEVADSFSIVLIPGRKWHVSKTTLLSDDGFGYLAPSAEPSPQGVFYQLSHQGVPHDHLWLSTTQPGLIYHELRRAYDQQARKLWVVSLHDPKVAAYNLSLAMDMAWNIKAVNYSSLQQHMQDWLVQQFGREAGAKLTGPMTEYYRLCGIRRPEFMGWNQVGLNTKFYTNGWLPVQNSEMNSEEFGNELERYLGDFERIKRQVDQVEGVIRPALKDAFFAAVKYPIYAASAMATKQLQAQEARHIGTARSFPYDDEAQESAVRSWMAYKELETLTQYYNKTMARGKWDGNMTMNPRNLPVFEPPTLPGKLTAEMIKRFSQAKGEPSQLSSGGAIAVNAADYTTATDGVQPIPLLGHSMKALALPKEATVTYRFYAKDGQAVLHTALIPIHASSNNLHFSVSIDGGSAMVYTLPTTPGTEQWKSNVLRGQYVYKLPISLNAGSHTLTIKALDEGIIVDQWMIDYDVERQFYMFPVKPSL